MELVLQILGGLFLLLLLAVVALIIGWKLFMGRLRKTFAGFEEMKYGATPPRLHLVRREPEELEWKDEAAVRRLADPLPGLGFVEAGGFETEELDFVRLRGFANPQTSAYAVVYEHDKAGVWIDFVSRYVDGTSITFANTAAGGELDQRPGHGKVRYPELGSEELYARFLAERPQRELQPVAPESFAVVFERAYADEMDWRNARGGPTEAEIRANAELSGMEVTDELVAQVRSQMQAQAAAGLEEALRERFMETANLTVSEWERVRDHLVFVHDGMPREMVEETFWENLDSDSDEDEVDTAVPEELSPRAVFVYLNERLPASRRFRKLAELAEPVPADVYAGSVAAHLPIPAQGARSDADLPRPSSAPE